MEKEIKVALLLYTQGLEYDDRIRKEILTLQKNIPNLRFKIFAVVPENKEQTGTTDYGVEFYIPYLKSRSKYPSGKKTLLKAFDFYKTVKPRLTDFDIIWCADIETFMFPLLLPRSTKLVWDQHEIPAHFLTNGIMKLVFRYMESKCNIMYHANQPRIEYLYKCGAIKHTDKHIAIRNFPENRESAYPVPDEKFLEFEKWLGDQKCAYVQGVSSSSRKCYETLSAILRIPDLYSVVVGGVENEGLERIIAEHGIEKVSQRIFFTGKVPQKNTKLYIRKCIVALVFYAINTPNNIYCEPNRMFQSIMMGVPVIVGCNPSMKDIIEKYNVGISLDNDGTDIDSIVDALDKLLSNYEFYLENVKKNRDCLCWDQQENILVESFRKVIK